MAWVGWLTRREAKEVTRQRPLRAALQILNERGETDVSAAPWRGRWVSPSPASTSTPQKDDLLHALEHELCAVLRQALRDAKRLALEAFTDEERQREQFRRPLQMIVGHRLELDPTALGLPVTAYVRVRPGPADEGRGAGAGAGERGRVPPHHGRPLFHTVDVRGEHMSARGLGLTIVARGPPAAGVIAVIQRTAGSHLGRE